MSMKFFKNLWYDFIDVNQKIFLLWLGVIFVQVGLTQSNFPVRTEWRSPDGSTPMTYQQWKISWETESKLMGGTVVYQTKTMHRSEIDSFVFGDDYAYFKDFVRYSDGNLCEEPPPQASFIVLLNGNDQKILTDDSPRWSFGDPNISGMGWFGVELGNFDQPEIAIEDSFQIIFSCYRTAEFPQQGSYSKEVMSIPLHIWPASLYLQEQSIPLPPSELKLQREFGSNQLYWQQTPGLNYTVYRRSQSDTLALNFPRFQYEKIAEGIIDSCYTDDLIDTLDSYGYLLFAKDLSSGTVSGRSRDICESKRQGNVRAILIQPELYPAIQANINRLVVDWEAEEAEVVVYSMQFLSAAALRDTLRGIKNLRGALLIGNFPVPWFQFYEPNDSSYQEYPADLFYMDLDGVWEDNLYKPVTGPLLPGADGIYDTHYDNYPRTTQKPEIVIGRITPTPGMGDAAEIISNYLAKVYHYRHNSGDIRQEFMALAYPDDDWNTWGNDIATLYISQFYHEYLCIYDINATTAVDYRERLNDHFSLLHVWVHSWSGGHAFKVNDGLQNEWFYNYQILPSGSNANFYQLFACGNSRYVEDLNCGAIYALQTSSGINTIGSTHSGGMLHFDYFYTRLAEGISFGEAFLKTLQFVGEQGFNHDMRGWYYGLTFNGDPFIIPQPPTINSIGGKKQILQINDYGLNNYPNPFNSSTHITFNIPTAGQIQLLLYNILGQKVCTLEDGYLTAGGHQINWDGKSDDGLPLPSGVYFCRLQRRNEILQLKKIILMQ
jgi:hypothetical protein